MSGARLATRVGTLSLPNPIICGSGEPVMTTSGIRAALAAGAAGVVAKSVNESSAAARQLDHADYTALRPDGTATGLAQGDQFDGSLFCRSGLAGYEPRAWFGALAALDRDAAPEGRFVAASIILGEPAAAVDLVRLACTCGVRVVELNVGAPHGSEARPGTITIETDTNRLGETVARARAACDGVLWVKLTGLSDNIPALAQAAQAAGADAVGVMGRFMAFLPDLDSLRPVLGTSGAYGGRWALPITCRSLALTRRRVGTEFPLIGTNGARTGRDVARFVLAGASAVEMTSAVLHGGFAALARARAELAAWLDEKDLRLRDIVGAAADALGPYTEQPSRPGHWRNFVPPETNETP